MSREAEKQRAVLLLGSFFLPAGIFFSVLIFQGFFPNGTKTTLFMDLKGQYTEFLASLRYIFHGDDTLFFSWSRAMGGNALGLYAYYTGGILSFLSCIFPVSKIWLAVEILEILEVGLCGLSFAIFLEWGVKKKTESFGVIIFSACYALMSYNMVYTCCFMWIDGCIMLPLIMLGIEKIFQGKKGLLFYIFLSVAMISNYYTAYMICIFSVFYVLFRCTRYLCEQGKGAWRKLFPFLLRYVLLAVFSVMTAVPVLYSVYQDLTTGKLSNSGNGTESKYWYDFFQIFPKFLSGRYDSITNSGGLPSVYCGGIVLVFLFLYLIQKKRKLLEKFTAVLILFLFLISFWNVSLDKVWHGFQVPNWFPWRYTFLLGFFMVYLAYLAFAEVSFSGKRMEYSVIGIMAVICIVETGYNASVCIEGLGNQFGYMDISEYTSFYEKTSPLTELAKSEDDGLYRMDKDYFFSLNDSMLLGYHSLTHYSSTYNAMINATTPRLGLAQTWFWNSGFGATPLVDSLLGVKYRMATKIVPEVYEEVAKSGDVTLYKNPLVLPFCFPAKEACFDLNELSGDVFQNQNSLLSALTGEGREYLTPQEYTRDDQDANVTLSFAAGSDQPMYLYMHATGGSWGEIYVNGQFVNNYFSSETTCAVYLGTFSRGERVSVEVRSENASFDAAWIAALHMTELKEALEKLRGGAIQIESHRGGSLSGTIEVGEGECIATSIPFEKGYTVKIDGKKVPYESYLGTFLAIRTSPGKHTLSLSFSPPGFKTGLLLSGIAICIMGFYFTGAGEILDRLKKSGNRMKRNGGAV